MPVEILEFVIRGVLLGVVYGLIAMPLTAVYVATDAVDLAIGGYAVLGAATAATVGGVFGIVVGIGAGALASAVMGFVFYLLARSGRLDPISVVLASFGLAVAISSLVLWRWGKDPFINQVVTGSISIGDIRVHSQGAINLVLALLIVGVITFILYGTPVGRSLRASAINAVAAVLAGIPVLRLQFATFVSGGVLGASAGILIFLSTGLDYGSGLHLALVGLSAAVVFGMKSPLVSFFGGVFIGVVEALAVGYLSGAIASTVPMIVILVALLSGRLGTANTAGARP